MPINLPQAGVAPAADVPSKPFGIALVLHVFERWPKPLVPIPWGPAAAARFLFGDSASIPCQGQPSSETPSNFFFWSESRGLVGAVVAKTRRGADGVLFLLL